MADDTTPVKPTAPSPPSKGAAIGQALRWLGLALIILGAIVFATFARSDMPVAIAGQIGVVIGFLLQAVGVVVARVVR